jgi:hypothetical protein
MPHSEANEAAKAIKAKAKGLEEQLSEGARSLNKVAPKLIAPRGYVLKGTGRKLAEPRVKEGVGPSTSAFGGLGTILDERIERIKGLDRSVSGGLNALSNLLSGGRKTSNGLA